MDTANETATTTAGAEPLEGDGHTHESACLNCGALLVGPHCHQCGQAAHVHRTLGAFFHDLLHGVFHFEGRIWRTLPMLALDPGTLTRRYIEGQRVRYVSPLALFLFSVFVMFATLHHTAGEVELKPAVTIGNGEGVTGTRQSLTRDLARLQAQRQQHIAAHQPTDAIDGQIDGAQSAIATIDEIRASGSDRPKGQISDIPQIQQAYEAFRDNPRLTVYKLQNYAYKYSWVLIPLSVPLLWLLFPFSRRYRLYDHTVFITYSLSAMTILAVLAMLADAWGAGSLVGVMALAVPVHFFAQLRGAYGGSVVATLARTGALLIFAAVVLVLFALLILAQAGG